MSDQNVKKFIIGLTGGVCSGKSLVADLFAELGVTVIDADVIARELVVPGSHYFKRIIDEFGKKVLHSNGTLNRAALRQLIFQDADSKVWLENLLHLPICQTMMARAYQSETPYCILVIPLLAETELPFQLNRVLVIDAKETLQRERLRARSKLSGHEIDVMLKGQSTREDRLKIADDVVDNNGSIEQLREQVLRLHEVYINSARRAHRKMSSRTVEPLGET